MAPNKIILLAAALVLTLVAVESSATEKFSGMTSEGGGLSWGSHGDGGGALVGDTIDREEEMMMESETARSLITREEYISYRALRKNRIPCGNRGTSYYNCNGNKRANPYRRGCSAITYCQRWNGV